MDDDPGNLPVVIRYCMPQIDQVEDEHLDHSPLRGFRIHLVSQFDRTAQWPYSFAGCALACLGFPGDP